LFFFLFRGIGDNHINQEYCMAISFSFTIIAGAAKKGSQTQCNFI